MGHPFYWNFYLSSKFLRYDVPRLMQRFCINNNRAMAAIRFTVPLESAPSGTMIKILDMANRGGSKQTCKHLKPETATLQAL